MSRKLRDVIPTATSQLLPQVASREKQEGIRPAEIICSREIKSISEAATNEQVAAMDGQPTSRSCLVKTAMGPARRNHAQIRGGARTEPAERKIVDMVTWTSLKLNRSRKYNQLTLANGTRERDECRLRRPHMELESAPPRAVECGLCRSEMIRKRPSRFKDYVM